MCPIPPSAPTLSRGRDEFVDVLRGYALVAITLNHFAQVAGDLGVARVFSPTLTPLGFSSAAELFVLCSGFAWARAAGRTLAMEGFPTVLQRALRRCATLLGALLVMTLACALVIQAMIPAEAHPRNSFAMADIVLASPGQMLQQMVTLHWSPAYLDVLCLYVLLIGAAPLMLAGLAARPGLTFAVSGVLYLVGTTGLVTCAELGLETWTFHPLAWQALFLLGMAAGRWVWLARLPASPALLARLLAVLAACFAVKLVALRGVTLSGLQVGPFVGDAIPLAAKPELGPLRAAHALGLVAALSIAFRLAPAGVRTALVRFPGGLGRLSLPVFVMSNPLMFAAGGLLSMAPGRGTFALLCLALPPSLELAAIAWLRRPWAGPRPEPRLPQLGEAGGSTGAP